MSKPFCFNPAQHKMAVIQREGDFSIIVHSVLRENVWSKNSLTKIEKIHDPAQIRYRYRGFTLPDLLTLKQHWSTILKTLATDLNASQSNDARPVRKNSGEETNKIESTKLMGKAPLIPSTRKK